MKTLLHGRFALPFLAVALGWLFLTGAVFAQSAGTKLALELPAGSAAGAQTTVTARLTDASGTAVSGATIVFRREVIFMNTGSELELGSALTNGEGVATVTFVPRSEGDMSISAEFQGDRGHGSSSAYKMLQVSTGPQLYVSHAGVKIPGLNVGLVVGILSIIWGGYFIVMSRIFLIAKDEDLATSSGSGGAGE